MEEGKGDLNKETIKMMNQIGIESHFARISSHTNFFQTRDVKINRRKEKPEGTLFL